MNKHTPGYEVLPDGRVFSLASNWRGQGKRLMKQDLNRDGYPCVRLTIDGKRMRFKVHSLVAGNFLPRCPANHYEICHIDGNKENNRASNLRWGTRKDNAADRERHGRTSRGGKHSQAIKASDHRARVKRGADHYWTKRRNSNV